MGENHGREFHAVAELFPMLRGRAFEELAAKYQEERFAGADPARWGRPDRRWAGAAPRIAATC